MAKKRTSAVPIGDVLRQRRLDVLKKGLRELAGELGVAPAHLTDLELGRRGPSEDLLIRISKIYGIDEAELRAGWNKQAPIVGEVATQDAMTAAKLPEFLRSARNMDSDQWNKIIKQARRITGEHAEE